MSNARGFLAFDPNRPADGRHDARDLSARDLTDLRRARAGDEQAFAAMYRRHSPAVFRYAWLLTGSESAAADVVQEAFIGLLEASDGFDPTRGSLAAYLCGIARFRAYRAVDRRQATVEDFDGIEREGELPTLPLDALERSRALERLYLAIRRLPPVFREVLILVELQELTYAEAAAIAGIEIGTVRSRLSRAKARLASMLCAHETSR
jgi:RNA polymerase sigma-70 factor (ECF subfamily)